MNQIGSAQNDIVQEYMKKEYSEAKEEEKGEDEPEKINFQLNLKAKEHFPSRIIFKNCTFNLKAKEHIPKKYMEKPKEMAKKKKNEEEQKLESIMKVIEDISASDDSYDEDKWYPEYKDCICCKGFVFGCRNKACIDLGSCYCKMRDEIEKSMFF